VVSADQLINLVSIIGPVRERGLNVRDRQAKSIRHYGWSSFALTVLLPRFGHGPHLRPNRERGTPLAGHRRDEHDAWMGLHAQPLAHRSDHDAGLLGPSLAGVVG